MNVPPPFLRPHAEGVVLALKVQPRAAREELGQPLGGELKIKVSAPPVDSAANEATLRFLAELLNCPKSAVRLIRGATSLSRGSASRSRSNGLPGAGPARPSTPRPAHR